MPTKTLHFSSPCHLSQLYGGRDENLQLAERALGVRLVTREDWLKVEGDVTARSRAPRGFSIFSMTRYARRGPARAGFRARGRGFSGRGEGEQLRELIAQAFIITTNRKSIAPKTLGQKLYLQAIQNNPIVFGIGPAGTGKTLPRDGRGHIRAAQTPGGAPHPHAPTRSRGRTKRSAFCPAICAKKSCPTSARSTTRCTTCSTPRTSRA